jgi:hypothetical protein
MAAPPAAIAAGASSMSVTPAARVSIGQSG